MICLVILLVYLTKCETNLVFSDEFEGSDSIDTNKWNVRHQYSKCNHLNQLNCFTNDKNNLRVIGGTLTLAAIRHKYLNKYYTSPYISTKESFTYGRVEIRAALPKGKMLRSAMYLAPAGNGNGEITILENFQTQYLMHGILYQGGDIVYTDEQSIVDDNLSEFNTYGLLWTESEIQWEINQKILHTINNTNKYKTFNSAFKLHIYLGIGGSNFYSRRAGEQDFTGQTLYERDAQQWNCSLLIIDYIRIYQNISKESSLSVLEKTDNISSSEICRKIMPTIRPKPENWKLIFSDEFNGNEAVDQNKWKIEHEGENCDDNQINQLHCKTNSIDNIKIIGKTLALAAISHKNLNLNLTAPSITTKEGFKFGRFEIRAALPYGKMLRPAIYLEPTEILNIDSNLLSKYGIIDIVSNTQTQVFYYGIGFYVKNVEKYLSKVSNKSLISGTLFAFHTYALEWTETEIRWLFDDNHLFTAIIAEELANNYNPFNKSFRLTISLGVDYPGQTISDQDIQECSSLILDYVRVYTEGYENTSYSEEENNITSSEVCQLFMPNIRKEIENSFSISFLAIILISVFVFLLALIAFNILLFVRLRRQKSVKKAMNDSYDDINDFNEYQEYNLAENTYDNPYEAINTIGQEQNLNTRATIERSYLVMTNQSKEDNNEEDHNILKTNSVYSINNYEEPYDILICDNPLKSSESSKRELKPYLEITNQYVVK